MLAMTETRGERWFACAAYVESRLKAVLGALEGDIESFQPDAAFMDAMRRTVNDRETEDLSLQLG